MQESTCKTLKESGRVPICLAGTDVPIVNKGFDNHGHERETGADEENKEMAKLSVNQRGSGLQSGDSKRLGATTPNLLRVQALIDLGVEVEELAEALDVTPATIRNWLRGSAAPRRTAMRTVDDLRHAVILLSEVGIGGAEAAQWLRSRQGGPLENDRPLDIIGNDPVRVIASIRGLVFQE